MNELILYCTAIVSAGFVLAGWRLGKERLYSVIIVFLILIASVGAKIVVYFGHETNTGNVFYASVYLATYFLIERYGRREGIYSIWMGVIWVGFFAVLMQLAVALNGSSSTAAVNAALQTAFDPISRVALASLVAYTVSQNCNVYLYLFLKDRWKGARLWLRANISNVIAQSIDSVIFFTVAFAGTVAPSNIADIILTGLTIKVVYMLLVSPLLYLNTVEEEENDQGGATITLHR